MFIIEEGIHAPEWIKNLIEAETAGRTKIHQVAAFVVIKMHDDVSEESLKKYPSLRDKSDMARKMLKGFGYPDNRVYEYEDKGSTLYKDFGFPAVGAQFAYNFKIFWKELN